MPTKRDHLVAQAVGGKVYAIAGRNLNPGSEVNVNEVYDIASDTWSTAAPAPTARGGMGSAVLGGTILVYGGERPTPTPFNQNEQYDPGTNTWKTLTPMPIPVHGLGGAVAGGLVYVPGGSPVGGQGYSTNNQVFVLGADLSVTKVAFPDPVQSGGVLTYTLSVTNTSANGITLHATITDTPQGNLSPAQIVRTVAITAPLGVWTTPITFTVQPGYTGLLTNVVRVTTDERATGIYTRTSTAVPIPITGLSAQSDSPNRLGTATHLTATIATGSSVSYQWNFGDGTTGSGSPATHPYAVVGTYTATVTATNSVSSQSAQTAVVVDQTISGLAANSDSPTKLGNTTHLTATIAAGSRVSYQWNFGDGTTGSGSPATHPYGAAGTYTAIVTATNSVSSQVAQTTVNVDQAITGLAANSDSPTKLGSSTHLTATLATGSRVSYQWAFGDGLTGSGSPATHPYAAVGTYIATVTATNSVGSQSAQTAVVVAQAISGLAASSDSPTVLGSTTHLTATLATGTGVSYQWSFGDGATGSGSPATRTYGAAGTYTAIVTATNPVGSQVAQTTVNVDQVITGLVLQPELW